MSEQTHFHYKGYRAQVWATERPDGGWVPHGKVTRRVGERDLVHPTAGNSFRAVSTKTEAEGIAKTTVMKYIDEQGA
jgi:hypothetical protein